LSSKCPLVRSIIATLVPVNLATVATSAAWGGAQRDCRRPRPPGRRRGESSARGALGRS
jgi:hypothetical protein